MIKSSVKTLSKGYLKVFNKILMSGDFPESGNSLDTSNY
jgi:hypothetical protein